MTTNGRQRARARVAHLYLEEGLVDEAKAELEQLISELCTGVEARVAESNGGGRREGPATKPKRKGGRPRKVTAAAAPADEKPKRLSPEREAELVAERRTTHPAELPAPVSETRSARAFTPEERAKVAEYARDNTVTKACEMFNLSWPCVRDWIEKHPRRSAVPA